MLNPPPGHASGPITKSITSVVSAGGTVVLVVEVAEVEEVDITVAVEEPPICAGVVVVVEVWMMGTEEVT